MFVESSLSMLRIFFAIGLTIVADCRRRTLLARDESHRHGDRALPERNDNSFNRHLTGVREGAGFEAPLDTSLEALGTLLFSFNSAIGSQTPQIRSDNGHRIVPSSTISLKQRLSLADSTDDPSIDSRHDRHSPVFMQGSTVAKSAKESSTDVGVYDPERIRNFCIIAHIDHGKSTLADRLLSLTKTVEDRDMQAQLLDNMDIERERGITIKLQAARMNYKARDGKWYVLNLIDTPGHVDFSYEVSRSLAACEGALLVVDAAQGVEAQTIANCYLAVENELDIIPVLNKIDLPRADCANAAEEIESTIGIDCTDAIQASAKTGIGIEDILEAIVAKIRPPPANLELPLRALIFDSYYDSYRGVVTFVRVVDGEVRKGDKIKFLASKKVYEVLGVGTLAPGKEMPCDVLRAGEVGYLVGAIKSVTHARVGDTIVNAKIDDDRGPLSGYREPVPMVFCGMYPSDVVQYNGLRDALGKLQLNDAALVFDPESSVAMGLGFRCGFLGLLHMDIVQERLEREFDLDLILTAPTVVYECIMKDGSPLRVDSPAKLPDPQLISEVREPFVAMEIFTPSEYTGAVMELGQSKRGEFLGMSYLTEKRVSLKFDMPLSEVITDFFDRLKASTSGYASLEYSQTGLRKSNLVRMDIKINGDVAAPLTSIVHRDSAQRIGKALTRKLKETIPRQQFQVPIQACIGAKPIASSKISALRKDVLAKCYGGDITRKKKLLQKQAKGKKRMKAIGSVQVPQEAFMAVLRLDDDED